MFNEELKKRIEKLESKVCHLEDDTRQLRGQSKDIKIIYETEYGFNGEPTYHIIELTDLLKMLMKKMGLEIERTPAAKERLVLKQIEPEKPSDENNGG